MLNDLADSISSIAATYPTWSGVLIFLIAMVESLAVIGLIVPGVVIMFAFGALISNGTLELIPTIIWAACGASFGDGLSFALGWHFKDKIYDVHFLKPYKKSLDQGHAFFERFGILSLLIGRFFGPIRAFVPLIAGILAMPVRHYVPVNIVASALWAPAYLAPGILMGGFFTTVPGQWLIENPIGLVVFVTLMLALFFFVKRKR